VTSLVVDTHALIWYLLDDPRLSRRAGKALDEATAADRKIYRPSMCIVEATYLAEKGRIGKEASFALEEVLATDQSPFLVAGLTLEVAKAVSRISQIG
jgi:predicted nucleic acid-binding protein